MGRIIRRRKGWKLYEDEDGGEHWLFHNQAWVPHRVEGIPNPFIPGQIVSVNDAIVRRTTGAVACFVNRTRHFKYNKNQDPVPQIELLGLPGRWFHVNHFTP